MIERPISGGEVALRDDDLARIGLAVVFESSAKSITASALRAIASLSEVEWVRLERVQFKQILETIESRLEVINDSEVSERFGVLKLAVNNAQEARHVIVHAIWGQGGETGVRGYDYGRERLLDSEDIALAMSGCAEIKRAASWFTMRVAILIEEGVLPERPEGRGMKMRTLKGVVRL